MNDQFKSVFSNIDKIIESEFEFNCKLSIKSKYQTMPDITITCEGIAKLLLNLNSNKARTYFNYNFNYNFSNIS